MPTSRTIDLTGKRFGKLTVLEKVSKTPKGQAIWLCVCDCGNLCNKRADVLKSGNSNSCGCYRKERGRATIENALRERTRNAKQVKSERLYKVWRSMIGRCKYEKADSYSNYGGRGISVCDEWRNSYQVFKKWALENGYDESAPRGECTIDRIDNDGNYQPDNCRWVSMKVQAHNKRARLR